jgi:hypothetical protein
MIKEDESKKLRLNRETVRALSAKDLEVVVGGQRLPTYNADAICNITYQPRCI